MNDNIVSILKDMPVTSWHFFDSDGGEVGKLEWANGTISFVGNADESAKRFFISHLKGIVDEYIKGQKKRGPYKKKDIPFNAEGCLRPVNEGGTMPDIKDYT